MNLVPPTVSWLDRWLVRWILHRLLRCEPSIERNTVYLLGQLADAHARRFYEDNAVTRKSFFDDCMAQVRTPW